MGKKANNIEPKILPLVNAINDTGLFTTFSSCQGHFRRKDQQRYYDRTFADVRFVKCKNASTYHINKLLSFLVAKYYVQGTPTRMLVQKQIVPNEFLKYEEIFVLTIKPSDRFADARQKRKDTDDGIVTAVKIIREAMAAPKERKARKAPEIY